MRAWSMFASVLVGALLVSTLWPAFLGGRASYVVVSGESMEPTYHTGDLVIAHRHRSYEVGDIVAFRTDGGDVIHRIIGGDETQGYTLQGDNKDDVDPWHPTPENIVGKEWLHVPGLGARFLSIRQRVPLPVLAGAGAFLLLVTGRPARRRRRRRTARAPHEPIRAQHFRRNTMANPATPSGPPRPIRYVAGAFLALASLVIVVTVPAAWTSWRSAPTTQTDAAGPAHELTFEYTAHATERSVVYPDGRVGPVGPPSAAESTPAAEPFSSLPLYDDAGDGAPAVAPPQALYTDLIDRLDITARYRLAGGDADVTGTYRLDQVVSTPDGWSTTVPIVGETAFEGTIEVTTTVAFEAVRGLVDEVAAVTGVPPSSYRVEVVPHVTISGDTDATISGTELSEPFAVEITTATIQPQQTLRFEVLAPEDDGVIRTPNHLTLLGIDLDVASARSLTTAILILSVLVAAGAVWAGWGRDPAERIALLYRSRLVDVGREVEVPAPTVRVRSFQDLLRVSRRDERTILHQATAAGHRYLVPDADVTYEYLIGPEPDGPDPLPAGDERAFVGDCSA